MLVSNNPNHLGFLEVYPTIRGKWARFDPRG